MGTFAANILPTTTGLSLGSSVQQWLINGTAAFTRQVVVTPFSSTPIFSSSSPFSVFTLTLTGNVASSTLSSTPGILVFQITQDGTGGRSFVWPTNFKQPTPVGTVASQVTTQLFYFDGTNAWPLGPGVLTP
jgi:hypothetical protein